MNSVVGLVAFLLLHNVLTLPIKYSKMNDQQRNKMYSLINRLHPQTSISCMACKGIVGAVQSFAKAGHGEEYFYDFASYLCKKFKIEDKTVCIDVCNEFKDTVWDVFFVETVLSPDDICSWVFKDECGNAVEFFPSWNISLPKKSKSRQENDLPYPKMANGPPVKVIQITDTHLDNEYEEGNKVNCGRPLCCRKSDGKAGPGEQAAPKWGYDGQCDTNNLLVNSMFQHMANEHEDVDYLIWTGDIPAHNIWRQSREDQESAINHASGFFTKYFPGKRVFPCLGNHEGVPVDNFPPPFVKGELSGQWLRDTLAEVWSKWLPEETKETIKRGGYYTTLITKGVRIISLNTNFGNPLNFWLFIKSVDPAEQLKWLVDVLQKAEETGEKVHIIGHMPPAHLLKWWSFNYYQVVDRYYKIIKAQFFGHTHHDEFRIFYDMKTFKKPINIAYIAPSVTTFQDLNPGYRVYEIDGNHANSTWHVVNHHTYFFDLPHVNKGGKPVWQLEYSVQNEYKMNDLSPESWNGIINAMEKDDNLFHKFYRAYYKQHINGICIGLCKSNFLCVMKTALAGGFHNFCTFEKEEHVAGLRNWITETYNKC